ncbi:MAG: hypothetical protein KC468_38665, partial [Myxococcales bacterium]|nr:hypothetical protein [Myxococcales bacterium]
MSPPEPRAPEARARVLAGRAPWALHALLDGLREGDDAAARATSLAELRDALVIVVARVVFLTLARARGLVEPTIDPAGLLRGLESGAARGGWATLASWSRAQHERRGGALFDPARTSSIDAAQLPNDSVARALRAILTDETGDDASAALPVEHLG